MKMDKQYNRTRNLSDLQYPKILYQYSKIKLFRDKCVALCICFWKKKTPTNSWTRGDWVIYSETVALLTNRQKGKNLNNRNSGFHQPEAQYEATVSYTAPMKQNGELVMLIEEYYLSQSRSDRLVRP